MTARWPAMMKRKTASEYCDMTEIAFEREVAARRLPPPVVFGERDHWRKEALDRALAVLCGEIDDSAEAEFWNRGQAA